MRGEQTTAGLFPGREPVGSLLEREQDVAILEEALARTDPWRSAVVVIEGPAGIGKTRLLAEGRRLAHAAGARTLVARASELEGELAFGVVGQLLLGVAGAEDVLDSAAVTSTDISFATLHALYGLTATLAATTPLVLAVDDLHWCDEPSLRFLNYLTRRLDGLPVTLLCTMRPREPRARMPLITELAGDPLAVSLRPAPLSDEATAQLVSAGLGQTADGAFVAACHTATGGNPLLLRELVRTLHVEGVTPEAANVAAVADLGPRAVSRAVLVRLGRLDEEALKLARAASILRAGADLALLAELAGLDVEAAGRAADALVAAEILSHEEEAMFVHPLVGDAVHDDVPVHERALAHERAAQVLHEAGGAAGSVAAHLLLAPARGEPWVCDVLERAAAGSLRAGAPAGAVHYLTRALAEPCPPERRPQVLLDLGTAQAMSDTPAAIERLTEAFEQSPAGSETRTRAAVALARALLFNGRVQDGVALTRQAIAELPPGDDTRLALEALELMAVSYGVGRQAMVDGSARRLEPDAGPGAKMLAAVVSRQWAYGGGSAEECAQLARDALAGGDLMAVDIAFLSVTAILTLVRADRPEADEYWRALQEQSTVRGSLAAKAGGDLWRGYAALRRGELDAAETLLNTALDEFRLLGSSGIPRVHHAAFLSAVLRERDDLDGARRVLQAVELPSIASDEARYWLDSLVELLLAERRWDEALAYAEDMEQRFAFLANPMDTPARSHRAIALYHLGRQDEGLALAREALDTARRWGARGSVARALRVLGTLEREHGLEHLREAVEVSDGSVARLEQAKALVALGATLRRARRPTDARDPLRRGLELAGALGAQRLVAHARHELRAAGVRPRTTARSGLEALTPSERRIVERAAAGQTNRVIAEALFVTDKTVELHLRNAYRKLGVRSRRELPPTLGG